LNLSLVSHMRGGVCHLKGKSLMKKILMIIAISLIAQIAFAEELPDTPGNRLAAAEKYLEVYSFKEMMTDFAKKTSMNLPQNERQTYIDFIMQGVRFDAVIEQEAKRTYQKYQANTSK